MDKKTIKRFLNDELPESEKQHVFHWLSSHENEHEVNAILKKHWEEVNKEVPMADVNLDRVFGRVLDDMQQEKVISINRNEETQREAGRDRQSTAIIPVLMKYAAVVLFTLGLGYMIWEQGVFEDETKEVAIIVKETTRGHKSQILMKDGSKIHLNAESSLSYNEEFGETNRDLFLKGEAYFEVAKNKKLPFRVVANNTLTTAVGTAFNISAYEESQVTSISLTEGRINITPAEVMDAEIPTVKLNPGEEFKVGEDLNAGLVRAFDESKVISWKDNVLLFENSSMEELISNLERWYNVKVVVLEPSRMAGIRANGKFDNESLENVLRILSYSLKFDYQINNDTVTIQFK